MQYVIAVAMVVETENDVRAEQLAISTQVALSTRPGVQEIHMDWSKRDTTDDDRTPWADVVEMIQP